MKKILTGICCLLAAVVSFNAKASHIFGGELLYTHLSDSLYQVQLVLYGDCQGSSQALAALYSGSPKITVFQNGTYTKDVMLTGSATNGTEVTPLCPAQAGQSSCSNLSNPLPGIRKFTYTGTTNLSPSNWKLVFNGSSQPSINPGRSNNITNIVNPGGSSMYLEAMLNNTQGENSSPQYTSIPTPFFCLNVAQQYNQGAVDPDGDVLSFSLTPGLSNGGSVVYAGSYSATQPMSAAAGSFSYNAINGQMSFTPDILQKPLIVNKVEEYKNGILVGTSMREMTFIILGNCTNNPPSGNIDTNIGSGVLSAGAVIRACQGTPLVSFTVHPTDPDGDTLSLTNTNIPAGAVINVSNNNTPHPVVSFSWNTTNVPAGNYTFYFTYKDNGCPLSSQQTQAYTIQIVPLYDLAVQVLYPTQCDHKAYVKLSLANGLTPRKVQLLLNNTVVKTYLDSTGTITDSLDAGNYTAIMSFAGTQCLTTKSFVINDSGIYPHHPTITTPVFYCRGDQPAPLAAVPYGSATIKWYDAAGTYLSGTPPIPSTVTPGIFTWLVNQHYKVCESVKDTVKVYVTQRPVAEFSLPPSVCTSDTATVTFTGTAGANAVYSWSWNYPNYTSGSNAGPYRLHWDTAGVKTISLQVTENQCASAVTTHTLTVKPTPRSIFTAKDICQYDSSLVQYNAPVQLPGTEFYWDFDLGAQTDAHTGIGPHYVHWDTPGDKSVFLQTSLQGCYDSSRQTVKVFPQPTVHILNTPETVCYGDKIYLRTASTGGSSFSYVWTPEKRIYQDPDGSIFTRVMLPTTYTVTVKNEFNCGNTDSITYTTVEPCCNFSYPTAFSPNGDGRNDHFSVVTYGNDFKYELRIFDRWGQQVFLSFNQQDSWDGTHNGKPCEIGTYFYFFKAQCMTGRQEEQRGEITLIR